MTLNLKPHKRFIWGKQRTCANTGSAILNEAHFYVDNGIHPIKDSLLKIPMKGIGKIETIEFDKGKTRNMNVFGIVVSAAGVVALIVAIVGLSNRKGL